MASELPLSFAIRPLINWLPDETLYSLASRYHRLSGNPLHQNSAAQLFGHAHGGWPHDLPGGLKYFSSAFEGALGSPETVAMERTSLPFFLLFREASLQSQALLAMQAARIGSLKMQLGLPASRLGAYSTMKACLDCMRVDRQMFGTAYWHRNHQFPGVWLCADHAAPLVVSISERSGENRFRWRLPDKDDLTPVTNLSAQDAAPLRAVSQLVTQAVAEPRTLDLTVVSATVLTRLKELGIVKRHGGLDGKQATSQFEAALASLQGVPEIASLGMSACTLYGQVQRTLRFPHRGHPLRHLLVMHWLFGTWSAFVSRCHVASPLAPDLAVPSESRCAPLKAALIAMVSAQPLSATAASRIFGVSVVTAQRWMAEAGIQSQHRASKIKDAVRRDTIAAIAEGRDLRDVSACFDISLVSVRRLMQTEVGLYALHSAAKESQRKRATQREWQLAVRRGRSTTSARVLAPRAYAWLYRNDRPWLHANSPQTKREATPYRLDWRIRDEALSQALRAEADRLAVEKKTGSILLTELLRGVPQVKPKLRVLHKLPLTSRALHDLTQRRRANPDQPSLL